MKEIIKFTAPNGVEVTSVVVAAYTTSYANVKEEEIEFCKKLLVYAQNRLVVLRDGRTWCGKYFGKFTQDTILVEYAVIPELDLLLESSENK